MLHDAIVLYQRTLYIQSYSVDQSEGRLRSPGDWAVYRFDGYRRGMVRAVSKLDPGLLKAPRFQTLIVKKDNSAFNLNLVFRSCATTVWLKRWKWTPPR